MYVAIAVEYGGEELRRTYRHNSLVAVLSALFLALMIAVGWSRRPR